MHMCTYSVKLISCLKPYDFVFHSAATQQHQGDVKTNKNISQKAAFILHKCNKYKALGFESICTEFYLSQSVHRVQVCTSYL